MGIQIEDDEIKKFRELMEQNKYNDYEKAGANAFINNHSLMNFLNNRDKFIGFLKAYEFFHHNDSTIVKRSDAEEQMLGTLRKSWKAKTTELGKEYAETVQQFESFKHELSGEISTFLHKQEKTFYDAIDSATSTVKEWNTKLSTVLQDATEQIKNNDNLYKSKLRLDAAVTYWQSRGEKYKKQGNFWLMWLGGTCLFVIGLLSVYFFCYPSCFLPKEGLGLNAATLKGTLILLTIISFSAYLIRIFSKLTFSSFHLQRDAEEREQLTHVYLALKEKHQTDPSQEAIILQSLFSRVDTGMLGGDHSPTMPIGQILDKIPSGK